MKLDHFLIGISWFIVAHIAVFFQLNGQFKWDWFKNNEILVAAAGIVISFFYIWGTKYTVSGFEGLLWPARFVGFGVGMIIYALGVSYFFKEGITTKTFVSLIICVILISIQVLWKN
jgi:hypothetical protein